MLRIVVLLLFSADLLLTRVLALVAIVRSIKLAGLLLGFLGLLD
jgi:hypothetical protein